jgi:CO/xanthine dehydrogenase Mo-binding subunit
MGTFAGVELTKELSLQFKLRRVNEMETKNKTETERYELYEKPRYHFELNRRNFLKFFGGGIVMIVPLTQLNAQRRESGRSDFDNDIPKEIGAWIHIDKNGSIKVFTGKTEMGQNIRTSLTQAVADELRIPISMIYLVMADTDQTPFDMGTFGSMTTPRMAPQLRKAAAAAREMLIDLAAQKWNVDRSSVQISNAKLVNDRTKSSLTFADIVNGQNIAKTIADDQPTMPATEWKIAGTSVAKVDGSDFVTGKHKYTSDIKVPGMLYAKVVRPAAFNATVASVDSSAAETIPSVKVVKDGNFIAVAAADVETARNAAEQIKVNWNTQPQPSNSELFDVLKKPASKKDDEDWQSRSKPKIQGSVADGLASADKKLEQTYTIAYIAHAPLETRAAIAEWKADKLTVWTGTQRPFGVRNELSEAFHIPEEKIRVIVLDTGSAYGGKHTGESAIEAARIARAAGKPVKLTWSREEEFTWAYFRPAGVIQAKSGVKNDGTITAWEFHNYNSGPSAIQPKYEIANQHVEFHSSDSPLRQGSYRALAATANHFARETHIDELAHSINMDPVEFRLKNIKNQRLSDVLQAAAKKFGWNNQKSSADRGIGVACGFEKDSYIATCAEIAVQPDRSVKVLRAVEAFDCGPVVNPNHLKNQIEGAIMMGIGGALFEEIQFENGKILNPRFSNYQVPRFNDLPAIEVVLIDRKDIPSAGAGETPIVGIAPAIGNAIFHATGIRLRSLPLIPNGLPTA